MGRERLVMQRGVRCRIVGDVMCLLAVFRGIPGIPERVSGRRQQIGRGLHVGHQQEAENTGVDDVVMDSGRN